MAFQNNHGAKRYWTKDRVITALQAAAKEIQGPLPCRDSKYNAIKKGRYDWPSATRVLEYFHSMANAWLAAGASEERITKNNIDWTADEETYLLDHAGTMTLKQIARKLHRTRNAVRVHLGSKGLGCTARGNNGYLSAAELAQEYNCSCHRIRQALQDGLIPGKYDKVRNRWQIDPFDILTSEKAQEILRRPKRTHKNQPTDTGNYYQRYRIKRVIINGKMLRIKNAEPALVGCKGK